MAATEICNRALSLIGTRSQIQSLTEASKEARECSLWYDTLRRQALRAVHWGFARAQTNLSLLGQLDQNTSPWPWSFKYTYPASCCAVRYLLPPTPPQNAGVVVTPRGTLSMPFNWNQASPVNRFIIANDLDQYNQQRRVVLSNVCEAQVVYTIDVTDTSLMDDLFQDAITHMLAARIVMQLTGKTSMINTWVGAALGAIDKARAADGNEAMPSTDHTPDWIAVRGVGAINPSIAAMGLWFTPWENPGWSA